MGERTKDFGIFPGPNSDGTVSDGIVRERQKKHAVIVFRMLRVSNSMLAARVLTRSYPCYRVRVE